MTNIFRIIADKDRWLIFLPTEVLIREMLLRTFLRYSWSSKSKNIAKLEASLWMYLKEETILIFIIFAPDFEKGACRIIEFRTVSIKYTAKMSLLLL